MWQIWLIISGICFVIEIATVGFFVFWFGIGALFAMITSIFFPENIILQTTVFVVSSVILLFLTKPIINKFVDKDKKVQTNAYSIIGKKGIVINEINSKNGLGQVKVAGEVWSAIALDDIVLEKGAEIEVVKIDGVKAVVKPLKVLTTKN